MTTTPKTNTNPPTWASEAVELLEKATAGEWKYVKPSPGTDCAVWSGPDKHGLHTGIPADAADDKLIAAAPRLLRAALAERDSLLAEAAAEAEAVDQSLSEYEAALKWRCEQLDALRTERTQLLARVAELEASVRYIIDKQLALENLARAESYAAAEADIVDWMKARNEDIDRPGIDGAIWARCIEQGAHRPNKPNKEQPRATHRDRRTKWYGQLVGFCVCEHCEKLPEYDDCPNKPDGEP